jgi:branched-chain amino acid transport system substrate-binding protein
MSWISRRDLLKTTGVSSVAFTAAGCLGNGSGNGNGNGNGGETFTYGVLMPTSGPIASAGEEAVAAAEIAVDQIANDGGVGGQDVEMVLRDTEADPETAVSRARALVDTEDVDVLVGVISSAVALAVSEYAGGADIPFLATVAQTPSLNEEECRRQTFRTTTNIRQQQTVAAEYISREMEDLETVASISPDYVYGRQSWDFFQEQLSQRMDFDVVYEGWPAFLSGEFQNDIRAALDEEPDLVHSVLYSGDMIAFFQQANEFDFFDQVEFFAGDTPMHVSQPLGDSFAEAYAVSYYYYDQPNNDPNQAFVEQYRQREGAVPTVFAGSTHVAVDAVRHAVDASGGTDADSIIDGLEGLTFESVMGETTLRPEDHQAIFEFYRGGRMAQLDDEEFYGLTGIETFSSDEIVVDPMCQV